MKKGIRQILCIMTVVISLLTTSALAWREKDVQLQNAVSVSYF